MNHTKRSPEFQDRIKRLIAELDERGYSTDCVSNKALDEAIEILEKYTTDSACIVKATDDEPIFVLRGRDDTADRFVTLWAERMRTHAANLTEADPIYGKLVDKANDALACAAEMREFPNRKRPD